MFSLFSLIKLTISLIQTVITVLSSYINIATPNRGKCMFSCEKGTDSRDRDAVNKLPVVRMMRGLGRGEKRRGDIVF